MNIKALREKAGITQHELSQKTNIPRDRIAKWEQGKGSPKAEDVAILNTFFSEFFPNLGNFNVEEAPEPYGNAAVDISNLKMSYPDKIILLRDRIGMLESELEAWKANAEAWRQLAEERDAIIKSMETVKK